MPASRWFAQVLMEASYASEPVVLKELERVFDAARPTKIDSTESYAIDGSFFIAHAEDCWGDIDIEVGEDHADLMSELGSRHIGAAEFGERWTQQLAAEIERIIRGHYQIDWVRWRGRIIHTTVTDLDGNTIWGVYLAADSDLNGRILFREERSLWGSTASLRQNIVMRP